MCSALYLTLGIAFFCQAADLNDILAERGACGVGFVSNLSNEPSFNVVRDALTALGCMEHRGGCGSDNDSGDGAGLMSGIPWDLFDDWASKEGLAPIERTHTGVGMVFLPQNENSMAEAKAGNDFDALAPCFVPIVDHFLSFSFAGISSLKYDTS